MDMNSRSSNAKKTIMKNIREAMNSWSPVTHKNPNFDAPVFQSFDTPKEITFARQLDNVGGKFVFCEDRNELHRSLKEVVNRQQLNSVFCHDPELQKILMDTLIPFTSGSDDFENMEAAITFCECLIARFGSVVFSSEQTGRELIASPPVQMVIAFTSQLVSETGEALAMINKKYGDQKPSMLTMTTGPSRTADIEKTLIMGAHGPKELIVFLVNDEI